MLYLDNSATTKTHPEVIKVMADVMENYFGNPSSLHQKGLEAEKLLSKSREVVARSLGVLPQEIIFTSGGTEGDNLALKGIALAYQNRGKHIITTKIEHPAIINSCAQLEELGFEVTYLDVDELGLVNPQDVEKNIKNETILISVMHVNNEVGSIQPLAQIGEIIKNYPKIFFHVDAVQGFGKAPLELKEWNIDLATISGHKIHGPKGIGALYVKKGLNLFPLFTGGGQENNVRSGTENLPAIVGFAKACQIAREIFVDDSKKMRLYKEKCLEILKKDFPQIIINGPKDEKSSPYILNISVPKLQGEILLHALEEEEVYVSTGSACSSKKDILSPVLSAMKIDKEIMQGSIRVSFSYGVTEKDIEEFLDALARALKRLGKRG
ncbi:MAG: cysteine desulfurase [Clostridia bacterium]|jgi:cysteine desulfurase|nr:cysteine desulfurase [Clostridia bacterium]